MVTTLHKQGHTHDFNEDSLYLNSIGGLHFFFVMDGCSSGKDSVFASNLIKKILAKYFREYPNNDLPLDQHTWNILKYVWEYVFYVKHTLGLDTNELESTLVLLVFDETSKEYICKFVGDGCLLVDGVLTENDQNNRPTYVSHHFGYSDFINSINTIEGQFKSSIGISTDGLLSFVDFHQNERVSVLEHFISEKFQNNPSKLNRLYNLLIKGLGVPKTLNHDDIAFILYEV